VSVLTIVLIVSTALCAFNLWFYTRFLFYARSWFATVMVLMTLTLLSSRAVELHKIEALASGYTYVPSEAMRIGVGLIGLVACGAQALAVLFHYDRLLKDIRAGWEGKEKGNGT
jgi:hypothetical protein